MKRSLSQIVLRGRVIVELTTFADCRRPSHNLRIGTRIHPLRAHQAHRVCAHRRASHFILFDENTIVTGSETIISICSLQSLRATPVPAHLEGCPYVVFARGTARPGVSELASDPASGVLGPPPRRSGPACAAWGSMVGPSAAAAQRVHTEHTRWPEAAAEPPVNVHVEYAYSRPQGPLEAAAEPPVSIDVEYAVSAAYSSSSYWPSWGYEQPGAPDETGDPWAGAQAGDLQYFAYRQQAGGLPVESRPSPLAVELFVGRARGRRRAESANQPRGVARSASRGRVRGLS